MNHKELVDIGYKWILKKCGVAFKELSSANGEIPDIIGFTSGESFLIECKTSHADFLADKRKFFRQQPQYGMGKFRFFLCTEGLIQIEELPEKWGLLYATKKGKVEIIFNPFGKGNIYSHWNCNKYDLAAENRLMYSALRRLQLKGLVEEIYKK